jgi:CHAT domain-containing protein
MLTLAGTETQVISLWPISDSGSSELMTAYYRTLQSGEGRSQALRKARLAMLANSNRRHPYYWASFIQSGEWTRLSKSR